MSELEAIANRKENKENIAWDELRKLSSRVIEEAKRRGADQAEISINAGSGFETIVRMGSVETVEFKRDKSLALTVYKGQCKGSVSTTDFSSEALSSLIEKACVIAGYTETDPAAGLPDKDTMAKEIRDLDLYHPWEIIPEKAAEIAKACEDEARSYDPRIVNSEGATVSTHQHFRLYANSHGFLGSYPTTRHSLSCVVVGKENGTMQRDYDYTIARNPLDLWSATAVGKRAAERTLRRLGARKLKTCQAPILFAAEIAPGLLQHFITAISGSNLYRRASFLVDHLGKAVFPKFVQIREEPHILRGLGSAPFDEEGVENSPHSIVAQGELTSYVLSSYSARKLGLKTTGNCGSVHNLVISTGKEDLVSLLKKMDRGLLVTEVLGHGVNIVTGDYSRGASGFWVENGEIQYPVEEITIAGNLADMFRNLVAIGNDIERRGNILTGSILLDTMTIAGN